MKPRVLQNNRHCYFLGRPCHIFPNTAYKGASVFKKNHKFDIDDLAADIYLMNRQSGNDKMVKSGYCYRLNTSRLTQTQSFCLFLPRKASIGTLV